MKERTEVRMLTFFLLLIKENTAILEEASIILLFFFNAVLFINPWPNEVASYLGAPVAHDERVLAITWFTQFNRAHIYTQVNDHQLATQRKLGLPGQRKLVLPG